MQRRDFLKKASIGAAAGAATTLAAPAIAAELPDHQVAPDLFLPEEPGHHLRRCRRAGQPPARNDRRQVRHPRLPGRRDRSRPAGPGCRASRVPSSAATPAPTTTSARTRPSASAPAVPFGMNARQQNAWIYYGGGQKLLRRVLRQLQRRLLRRRQHRHPDGRLVAQGSEDPG